ncbi:hypothetical protein [Sorangium sp. So ce1151]|uniref:hypothetical protein n=1 Tax=unclassified Sorangium TaxID=2621164 RepID=UPI003F6445B7
MGCYIDTPAFDPYSDGFCFGVGNKRSTASFKLFTPAPPDYVVWYGHPECTGVLCSVPISPGQTITMGAYYVYQGTPTQGADAVAEYSY